MANFREFLKIKSIFNEHPVYVGISICIFVDREDWDWRIQGSDIKIQFNSISTWRLSCAHVFICIHFFYWFYAYKAILSQLVNFHVMIFHISIFLTFYIYVEAILPWCHIVFWFAYSWFKSSCDGIVSKRTTLNRIYFRNLVSKKHCTLLLEVDFPLTRSVRQSDGRLVGWSVMIS